MKIEDQVCTIEQMNTLRKLGVDNSKASMCYVDVQPICEDQVLMIKENTPNGIDVIPVFTIADLIDIMPSELLKEGYTWCLQVEKQDFTIMDISRKYQCRYYSYCAEDSIYTNYGPSIIDAVYKTLVELMEIGLVETKKHTIE